MISVVLALGCGGSKPTDLVWSSENFLYFARTDDASACADLGPALESHRTAIIAALDLDPATVRRISYLKFRDQADVRANGDCFEGVACAPRWGVESAAPFDRHELVHAYLSGTGFPPWFLVEGAAVALSCQVPLHGRPTSTSWRTALAASQDDESVYRDGGWLVADLIARYGGSRFLSLYARVSHGASASEVANAFGSIYPVSLDEAWNDALARSITPPSCPWECSQADVNASPFSEQTPICGDDSGVRTFTTSGSTPSVFVFSESAPSSLSLGSCGGTWETPAPSDLGSRQDGMTVLGQLGPGKYFAALGTSDVDAHLTLPPLLPLGDACDVLAPLESTSSTVDLAFSPGLGEAFARVAAPAGTLEVLAHARRPGTVIEVCDSCARTTCSPVDRTVISTITVASPYVVHVIPDALEPLPVVVTLRTPIGTRAP